MRFILLVCIIGLILAKRPGFTKDFVEKLKKVASWEVEEFENNIFKGWSDAELRAILSVKMTLPDRSKELEPQMIDNLPDNFDPHDKWPACIHPIRDQGQCGSCWAFGLVESISDRFCIQGKDVILAPQDSVSCDKSNYGCNGGHIDRAWNYATQTGIVPDTCMPYVSGNGHVPPCPSKCTGKGTWVKYKCASGTVFNAVDNTAKMNEMYNNGPLENAFAVYEDFFSYKSGIYHHVSGGLAGYHATKTLGWGVSSSGEKYWIVANSWGTSWGMKGFFWIRQGDSQIDTNGWGCKPLL